MLLLETMIVQTDTMIPMYQSVMNAFCHSLCVSIEDSEMVTSVNVSDLHLTTENRRKKKHGFPNVTSNL